ncbi:MAG: divergent polysaccharide deacetylase family protein, partial [Pluralibacter sp.]|nr:divergent polysaccharide deacetylase family protein [Pluralibacter sp.]
TPNTAPPSNVQPTAPRNPFRGVKVCKPKQTPAPVYATRFFTVLGDSISQSPLVQYYQQQWQGWGKKA